MFLINSGSVWRVDREGVVLGKAGAEDLRDLFMVGLGDIGPVSPGTSLDREAVGGLIGIPADEQDAFGWAAAMPTRNASRQVVRSTARKYARQYLGVLLRVAVAPLMPLAVDRAVKELVAQWEETIAEQMQKADPQLAPIPAGGRQEDPRHFEKFEDFTVDDLERGE